MSKNLKLIEDAEKITINDKIHYLIKYKDSSLAKLIEENELSKPEIDFCTNFLLRKRLKTEENLNKENSKSKSKNNKKKINNKKDNKDEDSLNNYSLFSMSDIKTAKKKESQKVKEKEKKKKEIKREKDKENHNENEYNFFSDSMNAEKSESKSEKEKIIKNKSYEREGILLEDIPEKIINVGHKNKNDKTLYCLVKWKQQKNIRILDSIVENKKIKQICPHLLIDFYESKIMFLDD